MSDVDNPCIVTRMGSSSGDLVGNKTVGKSTESTTGVSPEPYRLKPRLFEQVLLVTLTAVLLYVLIVLTYGVLPQLEEVSRNLKERTAETLQKLEEERDAEVKHEWRIKQLRDAAMRDMNKILLYQQQVLCGCKKEK